MQKINSKTVAAIRKLRKKGLTHRQISSMLHIGHGSVVLYSKGIDLAAQQHLRRKRELLQISLSRLSPDEIINARRRGGLNTPTKFKVKYSKYAILSLIIYFNKVHGRLPFKREFNFSSTARRLFGSWNAAVIAAGFKPNPVRFAVKHIASDGHKCDSLVEKIIDDWLYSNNISHERNAPYGSSKFTADFKIDEIYIEFFGLSGQLKKYDDAMKRKLEYIKEHQLELISINFEDLVPKLKLDIILGNLLNK